MDESNLRLPKKIKKTTVLDKIKNKNRSTNKEKATFEEKIRLFNKQLSKIFSDIVENERIGMVVHTEIINRAEVTFIDAEGKERVPIDWGSEFSDSEEDIYEKLKKDTKTKDKSRPLSMRKEKPKRADQLDNIYNTRDELTDKSFDQTKSPKWKKLKKMFKKKGEKNLRFNLEGLKDEEPIYEEIGSNLNTKPAEKLSSRSPMKSPQDSLRSTGFDTTVPTLTKTPQTPIPPPPPPPPMPKQSSANQHYVNINELSMKKIPPRPPPPKFDKIFPEDSLRSRKKNKTKESSRDSSKDSKNKKERKSTRFKNIFKQFHSSSRNEKIKNRGIQRLLKDKKIGKVGRMDKKG